MKNKIIILLVFLGLAVVATMVFLMLARQENTHNDDNAPTLHDVSTQPESPAETRLKMVALGDMLPHESVVNNAKIGDQYDFKKYFENIRPHYQDADVVFCNQEALSAGEQFGLSYYPSFNAPQTFTDGLFFGAGCNVISLANNHMGDKTTNAINATLDKWDELNPLAVAGANRNVDEQKVVKYFDVKGIKFAFLAFADYNNKKSTPSYAVNLYHDEDLFDAVLKEARANAEVVVVSMHWGNEDTDVLTNDQKKQAQKLANANIDVVIGTGPHVLQKTEWLKRADGKDMLIWYSIGNMLSSQLQENELTSCVAGFEIVKTKDVVQIEKPTCLPTFMSYAWTKTEKQNEDLLKRHDLRLKLLKDSEVEIKAMYFDDDVKSRFLYIKNTLGEAVEVIQ
ncbi:MAG: CapA family protein [Candidatus Nomurabacteria bacterium]|jgi:poly-gamma-glutamate synthesis protein (capsule biosynthesis protein)|nr:CapA family protein [Candidatus Nomurabacteria bacterium]